MIISDLEHLEVVRQENQISGGVQLVSGSSSSGAGLATSGRVSVNDYSSSSASEQPYFTYIYPYGYVSVGTSNQVTSYASSNGSTFPY